MKIAVVGTGYVGLVSGTCLAEIGNDVICVDIDASKIDMLNNGKIPIYEPGLDEMVKRNHEQGRLTFTTDIKKAVEESLLFMIAVGTPPDEDGSADLQYVLAVAKDIATHMNGYKIIVDKSTVPVGTAARVKAEIDRVLAERGVEHEFDVASNPEFLKEGDAISDFMRPDRVVVGVDNVRVGEIMRELYAPFNRTQDRVVVMSIRSAEMTKYAANAMLATKISFMNELSYLCEALGADITDVRHGIGSDTRIGYQFIYPGCGYGGSCFPKDVKALIQMSKKENLPARLLNAVEDVNYDQKRVMVNKIFKHFGTDLKGKKIALWGLAFKPKTDDMREAPSLVMIKMLLAAGAKIVAYDPVAVEESKRRLGDVKGVTYAVGNYEALEGADALLLVTEWGMFRHPDFDKMKSLLKAPVIFDGRNQYDPKALKAKGFEYYAIGRVL